MRTYLDKHQRQSIFREALEHAARQAQAQRRREARHYETHCPLHDVRYAQCGCNPSRRNRRSGSRLEPNAD